MEVCSGDKRDEDKIRDRIHLCEWEEVDVMKVDGVARQEEKRRQQQRLLDVLKEGMKRLVWLTKIRGTEGDDPLWEELKEKLGAIY